ncbi:MAG: hypothetical protein N2Z84_00285, partial [Atribacterota bacterium]|nr:hypothetical protein [Atribacterota bacterium]
MLALALKRAVVFSVVGFFSFLAFFLSHYAFGEEKETLLHFFQIIYQWEPLQESEGVSRIIAKASHTPTSGPFQEESLIAFVVREKGLVVVDCTTREVILKKEFPEECILHGLQNGHVFYSLGTKPQTLVLSVATQKERTFPGTLVLVTEGGFLVTRERDVLRVFDIETEECFFSKSIPGAVPVLALRDAILIPTQDTQRNFGGYLICAAQTHTVSPIEGLHPKTHFFFPEYSGHTRESRYVFPSQLLPILREEQKTVFLEFLDETGKIVKGFPLADIQIPTRLSPSPLHFFDVFADKMLLAIEDETENFHFFIADIKETPVSLGCFRPRGRTTLYGAFLSDSNVAIIEEKGPEETVLHVFSPDGTRLTEKTLWPPGLGTKRCQVVGKKDLLATQGHLILRYTLPEGELAGISIFPEGYDPSEGVFVYKDKGFIFLRNLFEREGGLEKPALVAFDIAGESSPLPVELVEVSPHGESLYEVFEDFPTELRFQTLAELENLLSVSVTEVSMKREEHLTFTWFTPKVEDSIPKVVTIVASLGPVRKTFPMTVIPFPKPLELTLNTSYEGNELALSWTLKNNMPLDIDDLKAYLITQNLCFSHGDSFPGRIASKEVLHGKLYFELFPGIQDELESLHTEGAVSHQHTSFEANPPLWNGYTLYL